MQEVIIGRDMYTQVTPAWLTIWVQAGNKELFRYYDGVFPIIKAGNKLYKGTDSKIYKKVVKIAKEIVSIAYKHGMLIYGWKDNVHRTRKYLLKNKEAIKQIMQLISKAEEILASVA